VTEFLSTGLARAHPIPSVIGAFRYFQRIQEQYNAAGDWSEVNDIYAKWRKELLILKWIWSSTIFSKKKSTLPLAKVCGTAQGPQITSARDYEKNCLVLFPKYSKAEISATLNFFLFWHFYLILRNKLSQIFFLNLTFLSRVNPSDAIYKGVTLYTLVRLFYKSPQLDWCDWKKSDFEKKSLGQFYFLNNN
jgi:hypothetical protein